MFKFWPSKIPNSSFLHSFREQPYDFLYETEREIYDFFLMKSWIPDQKFRAFFTSFYLSVFMIKGRVFWLTLSRIMWQTKWREWRKKDRVVKAQRQISRGVKILFLNKWTRNFPADHQVTCGHPHWYSYPTDTLPYKGFPLTNFIIEVDAKKALCLDRFGIQKWPSLEWHIGI